MNNKEYFIHILRSTGREGVEEVIAGLESLGFFEAPASTVFHLNEPGGLLQHSLNVYREAMAIREKQIELLPDIEQRLPSNSVAIASLLHDACKAAIYKPVEKWRKDAQGRWESYRGYEVDYSDLPVGHGEKSVIMLLRWGLRMTDDEIIAIRWHMDAWDVSFQSSEAKSNISIAKGMCPLLAVVKAADGLASFILEA